MQHNRPADRSDAGPEGLPADLPETAPGTITSRGASSVGAASVVAGVSGLLVLMIVPRVLGGDDSPDTASFLTFWSLLFVMLGLLGGVQNEMTRTVRAAGSLPAGQTTPRTLPIGLLIGAGMSVLLAAASPVWCPALFDSYHPGIVVTICLAVLVFAGHSSIAGALSGRGSWGTYSLLVGGEAFTRLALVALAAVLSLGLFGLEVAAATATGVWILLVLVAAPAREAAQARADVGRGQLLRQIGHSMIAAASSATIVVGFPVALRLTTDAPTYHQASGLLLAISLTRAPLLMPLTAFQGVAITHFLDNRGKGLSILLRISALVAGVAVVGAGLAYLVGPWLLEVAVGAQVRPAVVSALVLAAGSLALVTLTGAAVLALGLHAAYSGGWFLASAVTIGLLFLPASVEVRSIVALLVGPLVGVTYHILQITRSARPPQS